MNIAHCVPVCGKPSWHFHDSVLFWQSHHLQEHPGSRIYYLRPGRELPIDVARNLLVRQMLATDADWLWFTDQDAAFLPGTLDRLLSWDRPVVSALEMMRMPGVCWPMALKDRNEKGMYRVQGPEVYEWIGKYMNATSNEPQLLDSPPPGALLEVDFTGCHCLLIRREVLERMEPPWFQGYNPGGEDQYFCEKARDTLGIKTYVDLSVLVGHAATDRIIGALDFMAGFFFTDKLKELGGDDASPERGWEPNTDAATVQRVEHGAPGH